MKSDYYHKYKNIIPKKFFVKKKINILEFGVEKGNTTSLFIELAEHNNGLIFSVDNIDYSKLYKNSKWHFINCRDDNFIKIKKIIGKKKFDIICLDTVHTKAHIKKILEYYFKYLNIGGIFLIDGICSLPYLKYNYRDNFYSEINNNETFNYLVSLKNNLNNKIDLDFSFEGSGVARIKKNRDCKLKEKKVLSRSKSFKNYIRKIYLYFF